MDTAPDVYLSEKPRISSFRMGMLGILVLKIDIGHRSFCFSLFLLCIIYYIHKSREGFFYTIKCFSLVRNTRHFFY